MFQVQPKARDRWYSGNAMILLEEANRSDRLLLIKIDVSLNEALSPVV